MFDILSFRALAVLLAMVVLSSSRAVLNAQDVAARPNVEIKNTLNRAGIDAPALYEVTFSYDFPGISEVVIEGLGTVRGTGEVKRMLTPQQSLRFRTRDSGALLATKTIDINAIAMGVGTVEMPGEQDYPDVHRSGALRDQAAASFLLDVVQKYFPSGFRPTQRGEVIQYNTTYRGLSLKSSQNRAEVAVVISQPHDEQGVKRFHLRYLVRDKPRLSDTWRYGDDRSSESIREGEIFIGRLIDELTQGAR